MEGGGEQRSHADQVEASLRRGSRSAGPSKETTKSEAEEEEEAEDEDDEAKRKNVAALLSKLSQDHSKTVVLVDMDNTLCRYNEAMIAAYEAKFQPSKRRNADSLRFVELKHNYPFKERVLVQQVENESGMIASLPVMDGAARALKEMRAMGFDVRICCSLLPNPHERIEWIRRNFHTPDWEERLIFTNDKSILRGDILIDDDPNPIIQAKKGSGGNSLAAGCMTPSWRHVVFDQSYNRHLPRQPRITSWLNWKVELGLDELSTTNNLMTELQYFTHGSTDSRDLDRYYVFPFIPEKRVCYVFCSGTGKEDRNIIVLENGIICWTHKGHHDECNNDLVQTYGLHPQDFPCPIQSKVVRNVVLKVMVTIRKVAALYYCDNKTAIKQLKGTDFNVRRKLASEADLRRVDHLDADDLKLLATQMAMSCCLAFLGKEVYTKQEIVSIYPELRSFIYRHEDAREQSNLKHLQAMKNRLLDIMKEVDSTEQKDGMVLFKLRDKHDLKDAQWNHCMAQCRGMICDTHLEHCIFYGLDHVEEMELLDEPTWPRYPSVIPEEKKEESLYYYAFQREGRVYIVREDCFLEDSTLSALLTRNQELLDSLDWEHYHHIFRLDQTTGRLCLVSKRHRHSGRFLS
ncbi:hypothetical protein QOT17_008193 [Balamuthia mandrillaris]